MKTLFVTGTDTGVGKTLITALLCLNFQNRGLKCGVMKPFASGCELINGELVSEDAQFLRAATGARDELDFINPIRLQEALAPLMAARRAAIESADFFTRAKSALETLQARYDLVLVEGVGGLMAPIAEKNRRILTCVDLIEAWQMPVVIVARRTLGTINHTLLTIEALREKTIEGLIFCDAQAVSEDDIAAQSSPDFIAEMTGLPIWGHVPFLEDLSSENLRQAAKRYLNIAERRARQFVEEQQN